MKDFRFESQHILYFLWVIPTLYFLSKIFIKRAILRLDKNLSKKLRPFLTASVSSQKKLWKNRLELLVLALLIVAYARPQTGEGRQQVKNEGIEILFLIDVSNSMLAEDIRPSRLRVSKTELLRFIDLSGGDRMGLVAFAGSAALLSPMTTDQEALKMYIESLNTDAVSTQGTNFTKALSVAHEAFNRGGMGEQEGVQVTRAVVIVSDGEDNEPGAIEEARQLVKDGIHIFTLGFGTEEGGAIPLHDEQGVLRGYKRDKSGQVILSKTKGTVLKELSKLGDGAFYHVNFQGDRMKSLREDIEKLKKSQFESGEVKSYKEFFQPILMIAVLMALFEIWLGERKLSARVWRGRFEVNGE